MEGGVEVLECWVSPHGCEDRMIESITIKNFRSISWATLPLGRTITAIVGANGSGKTNVLLALRFIANAVKSSPSRAVQLAGGIDQVFRFRERRAQECRFVIVARVGPRANTHTMMGWSMGEKKDFPPATVEYEFAVRFNEVEKRIELIDETLTIISVNGRKKLLDRDDFLSAVSKDERYRYLGGYGDSGLSDKLVLSLMAYGFIAEEMKLSNPEILGAALIEFSNFADYNINPYHLREDSDLLTQSELSSIGNGLPSFLHRLRKGQQTWTSTNDIMRKDHHSVWGETLGCVSQLLPFVNEILPSEKIDSTNVELEVKESHADRHFNTRQLSDGTLKYIALVAEIRTAAYSLLSLEEVENCLHPRAIKGVVEMMREMADKYSCQFLLTTHSETVLNQFAPDEVLIARRNMSGETTYTQPKNKLTLTRELELGGFGIGTYWGSHEGLE